MRDWKQILIMQTASLTKGIETLNFTGRQFLIVVDESGKLLGNVTDGDIRKGLIKHNNITISIADIMNKNTSYVFDWQPSSDIEKIFQNPSIKAIPVIDSDRYVVGCYFSDDFISLARLDTRVLIMAGGYGRRMGNLTEKNPKPMLKIGEKPILQHIIENVVNSGLTKITISTHFLPEKITGYFGTGENFGADIDYIHEATPLDTAGSIKQVQDDMKNIVIVNGDILLKIGLQSIIEYHKLTGADATMATHEHEITNPYGVVKAEGISILSLEEKPIWRTNVNAGIYVIKTEMQHFINAEENIDMMSFFSRLIKNNRKAVIYPLSEKVIEIGSVETYNLAIEQSVSH